jgi:hypothetical protein
MFIYTSDRFKWDAKRLTLFLSVDFFGIHSSYVQQSRREKRDNNGWRIHAESRNAPSTCQAGAVGALSLSPRSNTFYRQSRDHSLRPRTHTHTITDIRMQCIGAQAATLLLYAHVAYPEQACFKSPVVPVRGNSCTRERPTLARQDETLDVTA